MVSQGYFEVSTLAFYSDADLDALHIAEDAKERNVIRLLNPITTNLSIMRTTLAPSMLNTVVENVKKGNTAGRFFEYANVYYPKALPLTELPNEIPHVGFAAFGEEEDFFTVKGTMEELAASFGVSFDYERQRMFRIFIRESPHTFSVMASVSVPSVSLQTALRVS